MLQSLSLWNTQVHDLKPLKGLQNLHTLYLTHTPIENFTPLASFRGFKNWN
jgi:Leucine-rich repeat (LRR) protein